MTVYIDILIFVNIVVNTVILWVSAAFLRQDPKPLRFIGAVLICCVYGFFVCLPEMSFLLNFFCKVFFGGVISLIAFKAKNFSSYIKNTLVFFAVSLSYTAILLLFSGLPFLSDYIYVRNGNVYYNLPLLYILSMTVILCLLQIIISRFFEKKMPKDTIVPCMVEFGGKKTNLNCFVDSGNMLREAVSGLPVVLIEKNKLKKIVDIDENGNLDKSRNGEIYTKFRLIPYTGAGGKTGLLEAFKPDRFVSGNREYDVVVAVNGAIKGDGSYEGIIPVLK